MGWAFNPDERHCHEGKKDILHTVSLGSLFRQCKTVKRLRYNRREAFPQDIPQVTPKPNPSQADVDSSPESMRLLRVNQP